MAQQAPKAPEAPTVKYTVKAGLPSAPTTLEVNAAEGDLKPWDLDSKLRIVKSRQPRLEGPQKVTGRAKYTFDLNVPGMLWAKMIRAEIPAAEILRIDTSAAEALAGVKAVWTTEASIVRFAGQDIAAVAATTPEIAADAARLVKVTYSPRPFVVDLERAMAEGSPRVYGDSEVPAPNNAPRKGNVVGPIPPRDRPGAPPTNRGDVDKALLASPAVVDATYSVPVHTHAALETHGVLVKWDGEQLTLYASTQAIAGVRDGVAEALQIDAKNVTVITEHMGGGFGSKLAPSATGSAFAMIAARLAKQAGAPVKLMLDRHEEHLCTGNAPSARITVKIGADREGNFQALHYRSFGSGGVASGAGTGGPAVSIYTKTPNVKIEEHDVFTNAGPHAPLRAPGHPQGAFALESAVDELAHKLGIDPLELRRKNDPHPVRLSQYDAGAKAIGWERRQKTPGAAPGSLKRGIGMANGNWYVIARGSGVGAEVRIHRDGSIEYFSGAQDIGTGFRTAMAMIVAEELEVDLKDVKANVGDTRWPAGPASGGSNTTNSVGPVMRLAADDAKKKLYAAVGNTGLGVREAAAKMSSDVISAVAERKKQYETYQSSIAGVQFAEVEVDVETGNVRVIKMVSVNDCGFPINLLTTESQIIGAMIQGVSWALFENRILDRNAGTMVNPNLESYKILMPKDMFEAVPIVTEVANAGNNTSAAGIGEPCIVPTLAAVANAVFNATGVRVRTLPITPDVMLAALRPQPSGRKA